MLKLEKVTKKFGEITAVEDVSFEVEEGDFVFVTGPSGAGKTTLIRLIIRDLVPDEGGIVLDDTDITKLKQKDIPKLRQNIGVVFQDFKILPERTLRENVEVALAVIGLPKTEWRARVDHVLDLVDLSERAELFPKQLSGGELQRTSLARALVVNPKIVLADEPTGNLDWDTADALMELFERINEEGKTIIMATHHKLIVDKMKKKEIKLKMARKKTESKKEKGDKDDKAKKEDESGKKKGKK
jgi:cell division transport system ATP-binding protein